MKRPDGFTATFAADPPTKAQEAWYAATWAGTLALAVVLPIIGRRLRS